MDLFLPENQKFFLNQVTTFDTRATLAPKETPKQAAKGDSPDSDTVIGARIRPVLDAEKENGHIPSVYARSQGDFADVHELRRKVNGRPAITVCSMRYYILLDCGLPSIDVEFPIRSDLRTRQ
jgi:kinesin family protein 2/24